MSLFGELRRRNVFRVAIAYVVTSWLLLQVADLVLANLPVPGWVMQVLMLVLALGFVLSLVMAWVFEITPEGLKRETDVDRTRSITRQTGRRLDLLIIGALVLALGYFVWESRFSGPGQETSNDQVTTGTMPSQAGAGAPPSAAANTDLNEGGIPENSIAVLPFVNLSSDPEQDYFSDGISEELLNVLAQYPGLYVAARTSSFRFRGQERDIGEIAELLKVRHVLEGSVRKAGQRLRITAQLIRADSGYHLWSETFDREMDDIFAIQDEISAAIGQALRTELALESTTLAAPQASGSTNTAAYEAFLRGRHMVNQRGRGNMENATRELQRSILLDPDFAPAQAWLAIAWLMLINDSSAYGDLTQKEVETRSGPHIEKALALDPDQPDALAALGLSQHQRGELAEALDNFERALALAPVNTNALNWGHLAAAESGDWARMAAFRARLLEVDPLTIVGRLNHVSYLSRTDPEAARGIATELREDSEWAGALAMANVEYYESNLSESVYWYLQAYALEPQDEFVSRSMILLLADLGLNDEARRFSPNHQFAIELREGNTETAVGLAAQAAERDPENRAVLTELADTLYFARRFDEARTLYEQLLASNAAPLLQGSFEDATLPSLRLAWLRQLAGDSDGAQALVTLHNEDFRQREQFAALFPYDWHAEALARAVAGDDEGAFEALRYGHEKGLRDLMLLREPAFEGIAGHPEFAAFRAHFNQQLKLDQESVQRVMCERNPVPDMWQPLQATCAGPATPASL